MAVNSPESNLKFTDEQTRQLETWKQRVAAQTETYNEQEISLKAAREETRRIEKHNIYLSMLSGEYEQRIAILRKQETDLQAVIETTSQQLSAKVREIEESEKQTKHFEDAARIKNKLADERHASLDEREDEHNKKISDFAVQKISVDKAHETLRRATEEAWK